jgi:glycosyltransferase involved in cell wall biosynthesis
VRVAAIFCHLPRYGGWPSGAIAWQRACGLAHVSVTFVSAEHKTAIAHPVLGRVLPLDSDLARHHLQQAHVLHLYTPPRPGTPACSPAMADYLLQRPLLVTCHDPSEEVGREAFLDRLRDGGAAWHAFRLSMARRARDLGRPVTRITMPYWPPLSAPPPRETGIILSLNRLDWDKHPDWLVAAAPNLHAPVELWGFDNRITWHHTCADLPGAALVRKGGAFAEADRPALLARAAVLADLSAIKGDGGGTQYTFLEAWGAGVPLVVSADWFAGVPADEWEFVPGTHAVTVTRGTLAADINRLLDDYDARCTLAAAGRELLQHNHHPHTIGKAARAMYLERLHA